MKPDPDRHKRPPGEDSIESEDTRRLDALRRALATPPAGRPLTVGDIERRAHGIRLRRRAATATLGFAAACVTVIAVWGSLPRSRPPVSETQGNLAAVEARIADLERQVNILTAALDKRRENRYVVDSHGEEVAAILLAAGQFQERTRKDTAQALVRYREILSYWPGSGAANDARARIDALAIPTTQGRI